MMLMWISIRNKTSAMTTHYRYMKKVSPQNKLIYKQKPGQINWNDNKIKQQVRKKG